MKKILIAVLMVLLTAGVVRAPNYRYEETTYTVTARITSAGTKSRITCEGKRIRPGMVAIEQGTLPLNTKLIIPKRGNKIIKDVIPNHSVNHIRDYWERRGKDFEVVIDVYYFNVTKKQLKKLDLGIKDVQVVTTKRYEE